MTAPPLLHPTGDLVAAAWARAVLELTAASVGTVLPPVTEPDGTTPKPWIGTGFVTARVVGGSPASTNPMRRSVIQFDGWGARTESIKPQWNLANGLLERLVRATIRYRLHGAPPEPLAVHGNYASATVMDATALTEPRRVPGDPGHHARYTVDIALTWAPTDWNVD